MTRRSSNMSKMWSLCLRLPQKYGCGSSLESWSTTICRMLIGRGELLQQSIHYQFSNIGVPNFWRSGYTAPLTWAEFSGIGGLKSVTGATNRAPDIPCYC
ncbi:hypothetical protein VNO77_44610 [Canavalia gladiata]|uniref:Uncharacterized protein n=1 Tax=Canavalia gladiata TaxID=3824 RepID=A0AAN9JYI9_CANGL